MPKKIDPDLKARAVRLVTEHRGEYPTLTAASQAVAQAARRGEGVGASLGGPVRGRRWAP